MTNSNWNPFWAYQLDDFELHTRAERCGTLWWLIWGRNRRRRSEDWLTVRRIPWSRYQDVVISPLTLQSAAHTYTCVFLGDDVIVMINLQQLRAVQALPVWWCWWYGLRYVVSLADLRRLNVGYRIQQWNGIAWEILNS